MPSCGENQPVASTAASIDRADAGNRRRRLSKRERKNIKRKRQLGRGVSTAAPDANESCDSKKEETVDASSTQSEKADPKRTLSRYMENYVPPPPPSKHAHDKLRSLGKWFPKASVIKSGVCYSNDFLVNLAKERTKEQQRNKQQQPKSCSDWSSKIISKVGTELEPKASLLLFYQYVSPEWSQSNVSSLLAYLTAIAKDHRPNIGGRIRVSTEGVNATVSAASINSNRNHSNSNNNSGGSDDWRPDPEFEAAQTLRHFAQDLRQFDPEAFAETDFKFIDGLSPDRHFKEMKLLPVKELVFYGIRDDGCTIDMAAKTSSTCLVGSESGSKLSKVRGGIHLDAADYHEMLKRNDAVVIDVRNHYEAGIGRFDGQMEKNDGSNKNSDRAAKDDSTNKKYDANTNRGSDGQDNSGSGRGEIGAEYIDPKMRKSTDFTAWLDDPKTKEKLEGKTVMMFCTGGIRCERASAYLNSQIGNEVKGVYQLKGGIERYLQAFPEGGFWRGKSFVFDKREAIGAGNVNGDGGVVTKSNNQSSKFSKRSKGRDSSSDHKFLPWGTECAKCHKPWDRYIGKRKCYTCGVPVLVCDTCLSQSSSLHKKKKKRAKTATDNNDETQAKTHISKLDENLIEEGHQIRCPLCVEEGVTVPADDVEYTNNGVHGKVRSSSFSEGGGEGFNTCPITFDDGSRDSSKKKDNSNLKAAKTVLKWGGGHAARKKKRKQSGRLYKFGAECVSQDGFF